MPERAETTIHFTATFAAWLAEQTEQVRNQVSAAINALRVMGITLREPTSKYLDQKIYELRCAGGNNSARVFYAFDTVRNAVVHCGGSKADKKVFKRGIKLAAHEKALAEERAAAEAAKKRPKK